MMLFLLLFALEVKVPQIETEGGYVELSKESLRDRASLQVSASNDFNAREPMGEISFLSAPAQVSFLRLKFQLGLLFSSEKVTGRSALPSQALQVQVPVTTTAFHTGLPIGVKVGLEPHLWALRPIASFSMVPKLRVQPSSELGDGDSRGDLHIRLRGGLSFEPEVWNRARRSSWAFLLPRGIQATATREFRLISAWDQIQPRALTLDVGLLFPL